MKGMVFTEFLEMVEAKFSDDMVDDIIDACDLDSNGAYTAVGTYDYREMVALVSQLSQETGIAVPDLLKAFGEHLFGRFANNYAHFFQGVTSTFEFLESLDQYVHVEVRKLYPDADLPKFDCTRPKQQELHLVYQSGRALSDFAEGLIKGCIQHFEDNIQISRQDLSDGQGTQVQFLLTQQN